MDRLAFAIFFMAFAAITGAIVVALLTMNMSEPIHFYIAAAAGLVIAAPVSIVISKQLKS